jgi:hypothetical protein
MNKFNAYISKVRDLIKENPIKKSFNLIKDYIKLSQLSKEDLKKAAPNSWRVSLEFRRNFKEAVRKDIQNLEKKNKTIIPESFESERKVIYNEKFDLSQYIYVIPVAFYTFAFLLFVGEEKYEKFRVHIFNFLDKTLGPYLDDPETRAATEAEKEKLEELKNKKN